MGLGVCFGGMAGLLIQEGEQVDGDFSLRELIDGFLKSRPGAGEPLILTPIPQRDYWHEN